MNWIVRSTSAPAGSGRGAGLGHDFLPAPSALFAPGCEVTTCTDILLTAATPKEILQRVDEALVSTMKWLATCETFAPQCRGGSHYARGVRRWAAKQLLAKRAKVRDELQLKLERN